MGTLRQYARSGQHGPRPWWQAIAFSAAAAAALGSLFSPLPAAAVPAAPAPTSAVPDAGSRPIPLGTLLMPGQAHSAATVATSSAATGIPTSPLLAEIEKRRAEIAALGDQLIGLGQDRELAKQQQDAARSKLAQAQNAHIAAQREAAAAAANALRAAAALPPGTLGSSLQNLDELAQLQLGDSRTEQSVARQVALAATALAAAQTEQATAVRRLTELSGQYTKLDADIATKQTALQKLEQSHAGELSAAEAAETAVDRRLGAEYLAGAQQGRGADARAVAALQYALDQQGDPYQWAAEGPDRFDCSGLMYAAYHTAAAGNYPLARVARDQYWQTHNKVVDRYSLLPGDLLFFSSTNSWTGIHHVAMYAGNGMMVEAPRTGLNVRLTPVRWTRLFEATRVYGSVDGATQGPDLTVPPSSGGSGGNPPTSITGPTTPTTRPTTGTTTRPTTAPTSPSSRPSSSPPPTSSSPSPSGSPSSTSPSPSESPSSRPPATTGSPSSPSSTSSKAPSSASTTSSSAASTSSSAATSSSTSSSSTTKPKAPPPSASASDSASPSAN